MYDAIFFDLDGTLIDTERLAVQTGAAAFAAFGHQDSEDLLMRLIGVDQPTSARLIAEACPGLDAAALRRHWNAGFDHALAHEVPMKPGARELVQDLARQHPLALVTSSGRAAALDKLTRSGLMPSFRAIIAREDVTQPKPAPEPYLLAASRLGARAERCLVFEDSEPGAEAAHAAGMRVVQVADLLPPTGRFAHHVAADLRSGAAWAGLAV